MSDLKKIKAQPGYPLVPGANQMMHGYNFAVEVPQDVEASLLLYRKKSRKPSLEIPFIGRTGNVCSLFLPGFDAQDYEYNYSIDGKIVQDTCAYAIHGREHFGAARDADEHKVRCGFLPQKAGDWEGDAAPEIPYQDLILYKLHVRGYTKTCRNITGSRGTFQALTEMIPYWKELGVNAIELMPAYEFQEVLSAAETKGMISEKHKEGRVNYWGYTDGFYFAPKRAYCATNEPETEVRNLIKSLHKAGMECIMEMYFPHKTNAFTALRALQFWKIYYHVDGFHILGDGAPVNLILNDPVLDTTKLMFQGFDENEIRDVKAPKQKNVALYNAEFLQDMRRFLKSDEETVQGAAYRIRRNPDKYAVVNYMACQDGFTLNDMVTFNYRHNEANGEDNQDGSSYNYSWNCGVEGPSRKQNIRQIRARQMRNAFLMMILGQGVPMIYGGDEIANSQGGNNNAYCQDNQIGWTDWKSLAKNEELLAFVKNALAFRKEHTILHTAKEMRGVDYLTKGFPDISFHGERAWYCSSENTSRLLGVMYCGAYAEKENKEPDDFLYVGYNFHWESRSIALPNLPGGKTWVKVADTAEAEGFLKDSEESYKKKIEIDPRSIVVLIGKQEVDKNAPVASL